MEKIFIVTSGCYSDYRIEGAFSTKQGAEDFVGLLRCDEPNIETFNIDEVPEHPPGQLPFSVVMDRDGNSSPARCGLWDILDITRQRSRGDVDGTDFRVWATDEKHAVKIANEKRTQLIATGMWVEHPNHYHRIPSGAVIRL